MKLRKGFIEALGQEYVDIKTIKSCRPRSHYSGGQTLEWIEIITNDGRTIKEEQESIEKAEKLANKINKRRDTPTLKRQVLTTAIAAAAGSLVGAIIPMIIAIFKHANN